MSIAKAAPNMLAALKAIAPLLTVASKAYQFGPTSYTCEALIACQNVRDLALAAIAKAEMISPPDATADGEDPRPGQQFPSVHR
jgi:hypothetical protein